MSNTQQWHYPEWLSDVHDWIYSAIDIDPTKEQMTIEEIHSRVWSHVLSVTTHDDKYFFKAISDIPAYEAELTHYLTTTYSENLPVLVAFDSSRGWMLMRDGGKRLRETLIADPDMKFWEELLPLYAQLQIKLMNHTDKLKQIGVPDVRLEVLPKFFREILEQKHYFRVDLEDGLTATQYQTLLDLLPTIKQKCDQLASYNIRSSLNHGDLHDGNIFYNDGKYVFFDWGDATITHPFFSLRTAYVSAETRFGLEEYDSQLNRLRDAYLRPWREFENEKRLLNAFDLAIELWALGSLFTWYAMISNLSEAEQMEYKHIIPSLAEELLSLIKP